MYKKPTVTERKTLNGPSGYTQILYGLKMRKLTRSVRLIAFLLKATLIFGKAQMVIWFVYKGNFSVGCQHQ